jgi:hypothetical protein
MKKYLSLILILIVSIGFFGLILIKQAHAQTQSVCPSTNPTCNSTTPAPTPQQGVIPGGLPGAGTTLTNNGAGTTTQTISTQYNLLEPLPQVGPTFDTSQSNGLGSYLNPMISLFIGICAVLAMIMILWGGIEYMTSELISSKEAGKERIRNAIFGLLLALGAWTLLYTINPNLLNSDINITTANATANLNYDNVPQTPTIVNGKPVYGGYASGSSLVTDYPQDCSADAVDIQQCLPSLPAGVNVCATSGACGVNAQCTTVGQTKCTSTLGLNTSIVNSLASGCAAVSGGTPCDITITAGTEYWLHNDGTSHQPGSSTVDIRATSDIDNYITDSPNFPSGNNNRYLVNGACYFAEPAGATAATTGNHWHVYAVPSSGNC